LTRINWEIELLFPSLGGARSAHPKGVAKWGIFPSLEGGVRGGC